MAYVEPAYLLFGRNGARMAQRFDAKRTQTLGEPIRIADSLEATSGFGYSFSVSNNESQAASRLETMIWRHSGSPDGHSVIFSSPRDGLPPNLYEKSLISRSEERRL